jgi:hypothetical protein
VVRAPLDVWLPAGSDPVAVLPVDIGR